MTEILSEGADFRSLLYLFINAEILNSGKRNLSNISRFWKMKTSCKVWSKHVLSQEFPCCPKNFSWFPKKLLICEYRFRQMGSLNANSFAKAVKYDSGLSLRVCRGGLWEWQGWGFAHLWLSFTVFCPPLASKFLM